MDKILLGDRLKQIEQQQVGKCVDKTKPIMARLDGRAFHTFTRDLGKPYDYRLSDMMFMTTSYLIQETHAKLGYTQSDEISLYWELDLEKNPDSEYLFNGNYQKLVSILAGLATGFFNRNLENKLPNKLMYIPIFDCRVWNVDDNKEVYLNFLWRQDDAIKNSISMAAQFYFSHSELLYKDSIKKKEMLKEIGHPWEDLPDFFKYGAFFGTVVREVELTEDQLLCIPQKFRPIGPVKRTFIEDLNIGPLRETPAEKIESLFGYKL